MFVFLKGGAEFKVPPPKTNMTGWKIFIHDCFSIVMLVFGGGRVSFKCLNLQKDEQLAFETFQSGQGMREEKHGSI